MTKASDNAFPSILITEGTEPSAPAAGKQRLYIDSTSHLLKATNSSGTDRTIEGLANPMTTAGDIIYGGASGVPTRLQVGTALQVLRTNAGATAPEWATAAGGATTVYKSADEIVNNSSALQDDNHLIFALAATGEWEFEVNLWYDSGTTPDLKVAFTIPASTTLYWAHTGADAALSSHNDAQVTTASAATRDLGGNGAGTIRHARIKGYVRTTGTSGNLTMQWAQNTANASDTTIKRGSAMKVWTLA